MKRFFKFFAPAGLLLALFAVAGCSLGSYGLGATVRYDNAKLYTAADNAEVSGAIALDVEWQSGSVTVEYYDGTAISVSEQRSDGGKDDDFTMRYYLDGTNTLNIRFAKSGKRISGNLQKSLAVLVPTGTSLTELDIKTLSADAAVKVDCVECEIDTVSGDILLSGANVAFEAELQTVSGAVTLFETTVGTLGTDTVSGTVTLLESAVTGGFDADTVSGKITAEFSALPDRLEVDTTSGSIDFTFPDEAGFTVRYSTVSGRFTSDFGAPQNGLLVHAGTPSCYCEIDTTSGDLNIARAE